MFCLLSCPLLFILPDPHAQKCSLSSKVRPAPSPLLQSPAAAPLPSLSSPSTNPPSCCLGRQIIFLTEANREGTHGLSEAQHLISAVTCVQGYKLLHHTKATLPFLPSSLICPFATPLKATLLTATVSPQECLDSIAPGTPQTPQASTKRSFSCSSSFNTQSSLPSVPNSFSVLPAPYLQPHENRFPHHEATLISSLCPLFLCQSCI